MKFIIVEIKDKDLYTIYDEENKGVCCCSMYTLKQLVKDYKCKVVGLKSKNNKLYCEEHNFDGTVRKRKAPVICADETKRSAKIIIRGLYEKDYPKETKGRAGVLSNLELGNIVYVNDKFYGVICRTIEETGLVCVDTGFNIIKKDCIDSITKKVPKEDYMKESLQNILDLMEKRYKLGTEIVTLEKALDQKKKKYEMLTYKRNEIIKKNQSLKYDKIVTGNEEFSQSFYDGTLDIAFVEQVIKKTNRQITYTYGLSYRHPTTYHKPISKELALSYLSHGLIDVRANKDEVNINEYSENDMW